MLIGGVEAGDVFALTTGLDKVIAVFHANLFDGLKQSAEKPGQMI